MPVGLGGTESTPFDVVGVGVNTVDLVAVVDDYPAPDSKHRVRSYAEFPGGETATALAACARLGWRTRYVGRFGRDERGRAARAALERDGVDLSACDTAAAPQPVSVIVVDDQGRRTVLWSRESALDLATADLAPAVVAAGRVVLVDAQQPAAAVHAARCARDAGIPTVLDIDAPGPDQDALLAGIDIIITSAAFPEAFTGAAGLGAALSALASRFKPRLLCATLGRQGSLAIVAGEEIQTAGFEVPVVDSTGAGDAFRGGFIAGWLAAGSHPQVDSVLTYANAVAALSCGQLGARSGLPTRDEVARVVSGGRRTV
jgi:sugar/nucleoside kinase (ribokinase family)